MSFFFELVHKTIDLSWFLNWFLYGPLADLFTSSFIKVIRNACHLTQLRHQIGDMSFSAVDSFSSNFILDLQQRLFLVLDLDIVSLLIVFL